jgi:hypothetical protein
MTQDVLEGTLEIPLGSAPIFEALKREVGFDPTQAHALTSFLALSAIKNQAETQEVKEGPGEHLQWAQRARRNPSAKKAVPAPLKVQTA